MMPFRKFAVALTVLTSAACAMAQDYPTQQARMLVGWAPGGANDAIGRIVSQGLQNQSGKPVTVFNKPGAGSTLAADELAKAKPDGHTLLMGSTGGQAIAPLLFTKLTFDPFKDIVPVTLVARTATALVVHSAVPAKDVRELLSYLKANPGKTMYASGGNGTGAHLTAELFKSMAGVDVEHVPYKGDAPAVTDVMAGNVQMAFTTLPAALAGVKTGKIRMLAVSTASRVKSLPDIPTIAESGVPGFDISTWYGVFTTAKTPQPVVDAIAREVAKVVAAPDAQAALIKQGVEPVTSTPAEFARYFSSEAERWAKLARSVGLQAQ
ncbi:Bug family tripartite tricarboxylate transporter substrate binding protein [Noviherbaspirillum aerium]|uniref:Bug family tripartite tricarboxylate transporter substrate binding protein n=1 Tax=Noviherbaspirillum aerium TaxID=2588497 RepID=UPI001CEF842B|nr:tripartite tricarboxylate transporter substrate binding protein [Noviherbaspirillum aerium]